ncbi:MAG TPA: hypothetical protein QF469_12445 [Sphingomonas sanguinis]|uniref:hypothetical protein n=1 Tax=Sphingomonas sanguinis TaxID=33051 RepID=UPI002ABFC627|nr:hypothetical protein [Sphingomonas sanguinis]
MILPAYPVLFALAAISPMGPHDHPVAIAAGDDPCPLSAAPMSDATPCYEPPAHPRLRRHHAHKDFHDRAGPQGLPGSTAHHDV